MVYKLKDKYTVFNSTSTSWLQGKALDFTGEITL